jgi:hypothetical protein
MSDEQDRRPASAAEAFGLARTLNWFDGFSIALGVPALLLFSVGSIVVLTGTLSPLIWIVSVSIGLLQAFIFAEMAGLFPTQIRGSLAIRLGGVAPREPVPSAGDGVGQLVRVVAGAGARGPADRQLRHDPVVPQPGLGGRIRALLHHLRDARRRRGAAPHLPNQPLLDQVQRPRAASARPDQPAAGRAAPDRARLPGPRAHGQPHTDRADRRRLVELGHADDDRRRPVRGGLERTPSRRPSATRRSTGIRGRTRRRRSSRPAC